MYRAYQASAAAIKYQQRKHGVSHMYVNIACYACYKWHNNNSKTAAAKISENSVRVTGGVA